MRVLVTGAFGNLGRSTLEALLSTDHEVTVLDVFTQKNRRAARKLNKIRSFETIWGSILDSSLVEKAVCNQECIIHLAAVTPPLTESNPKLAQDINVKGTKNIIINALRNDATPKFIFPSSVSIYGPLSPSIDQITSSFEINPTDNYTRSKAEAEKIIKESGLSWTILRITLVPTLSVLQNPVSLLYNIPLEQKLEFAHTRDIGKAIVNSITASTENKILLLGGGEKNRFTNREFLQGFFSVLGIGTLPDEVFRIPKTEEDWYYTGWMNSEESQRLLKYQTLSYEDYLNEIKRSKRFLRVVITLFRPIVKFFLIKQSPYYLENKKNR